MEETEAKRGSQIRCVSETQLTELVKKLNAENKKKRRIKNISKAFALINRIGWKSTNRDHKGYEGYGRVPLDVWILRHLLNAQLETLHRQLDTKVKSSGERSEVKVQI